MVCGVYTVELKICKRCLKNKNKLDFNLRKDSKDGLTYWCKSCINAHYSLNNYGKWHIDHIVPLSSASDEKRLYQLCHYTNLQSLWAKDNIRKGAYCGA